MSPIYTDSIHTLEEIDKREADRYFDNAVKHTNIRYAKRAYRSYIGTLIVAASSFIWQIYR